MVNTQCSFLTCPMKSKEWGFHLAWLKIKQCGEIKKYMNFKLSLKTLTLTQKKGFKTVEF